MTARALPSVSDDERIMPLLNSLTTAYVGEDYSNTKFEVCGQTFPQFIAHAIFKKTSSPRNDCISQFPLFFYNLFTCLPLFLII